jgi:hypothetical protein
MGGNSTRNVNKIDFIAFVTCFMMTKRNLNDKEQNSIWISNCFLRLRIMKNQYVNWVYSVNFNYTPYVCLFETSMAVVSILSDILSYLIFNNLADYLKINFNSRQQKFWMSSLWGCALFIKRIYENMD